MLEENKIEETGLLLLLTLSFVFLGKYKYSHAASNHNSQIPPYLFATSNHFETAVVYFEITPKDKGIKCIVELEIIKPFTKTVFAEIQFKNPKKPELPLIVNQTIKSNNQFITIHSPVIHDFREGVDYDIKVLVYADEQKLKLLAEHIQSVHPEFGLLLGKTETAIMYVFEGNFANAEERFKWILEDDKFDFRSTNSLDVLNYFKKGLINREYIDYFFKGLAYDINKEFAKAINEFKNAIAIDANYPEVYCYIGNNYSFLNSHKEAIPFYEKCIQLKPDCAIAYWRIASAYGALNEQQKEKEYLQKAGELFQKMGNYPVEELIKKLNT